MRKREKAESSRQKAESSRHPRVFCLPPSAYCFLPSAFSSFVPYLVWSITAVLVLAFVSLIVVAPLAAAHDYHSSAFVLYEMFGRVCHQIPERAFFVEGHPLAVCARCSGIYFGFAAGVLLYPLVRSLNRSDAPARKWLLLALAPTLVDFALGFFNLWENTHLSRSATGAFSGGVAAFYVLPGLLDLGRMMMKTNER